MQLNNCDSSLCEGASEWRHGASPTSGRVRHAGSILCLAWEHSCRWRSQITGAHTLDGPTSSCTEGGQDLSRRMPRVADKLHLLPPVLEPSPGAGLMLKSWPGVCYPSAGWLDLRSWVNSDCQWCINNEKNSYARWKVLSLINVLYEGLLLDCWHSYLDDKGKKKKVTHGVPSYNFYTNANSVLKLCHSFWKGRVLTGSRVHLLRSHTIRDWLNGPWRIAVNGQWRSQCNRLIAGRMSNFNT